MGLKDTFIGLYETAKDIISETRAFSNAPEKVKQNIRSNYDRIKAGVRYFDEDTYQPLFWVSYDGEKTKGELGDVKKYVLRYRRLRNRAWEAFLDNDIAQIMMKKFVLWVVGSGLKIQNEPIHDLVKSLDKDAFTKDVEMRFKLWAKSRRVAVNKRQNLHKLAKIAKKNSLVGGDLLVVTKVVKGELQVELIDGDRIATPHVTSQGGIQKKDITGKFETKYGIVMEKETGVHVAYYVAQNDDSFIRIKAQDRSGQLRAWMVFGMDYRIDNVRGIPAVSGVLESIRKLDRYKEALVGGAEERAKVPFTIEHGVASDGENPLMDRMKASINVQNEIEETNDPFNEGEKLGRHIARTSQKSVYNMPVDSKLVALESKMEKDFGDFYTNNMMVICATIGIPYEVALAKYDSNFSASRAALKDWEHVISVARQEFANDFYQPIFSLWLNLEVMTGRINEPNLIMALLKKDWITEEAIKNTRWLGVGVPHIDPLKEVQAARLKLGDLGKNAPLSTVERETEQLNGGEYAENVVRFNEEIDQVAPVVQTVPGNDFNDDDDDDDDDDNNKK